MSKKLLLTAAAAAILLSGCLLSGTFSFSVRLHDLEATFNNGYTRQSLDLSAMASTWSDHEDEIAQIESIHLDAIVVNNATESDTLGVYLSDENDLLPADFVSVAYPVMTGYVVPARTTDTLTIPEADKLLHLTGSNWNAIQNLVKTGKFTAYVSSSLSDANVSIQELNMYISFTTTK